MSSLRKSRKVNEAAYNEINWGDSLIGRLINSGVRKAKIGYNLNKVDSLVKAFARELDTLIASGLQKEAKDKFTELLLKSYFSELENICTSDNSDNDKMDKLVGDHVDLWDAKDPNGGMWKDNVRTGYLRQIFEDLDNNTTKEQIRKINLDKDNLLDNVSNLIDNLRRLTSTSTASNVQQAGYQGFITNFGNVTRQFTRINAGFDWSSTTYLVGVPINEDSVFMFKDFVMEATQATQSNVAAKPDAKQVTTTNTPTKITGSQSTGSQSSPADKKPATPSPKDGLGETPELRIKKLKELATKSEKIEIDPKKPFENEDVKKYVKCLLSLTDDDVAYFQQKNKDFKIKIGDKDLDMPTYLQTLNSDPELEPIKKEMQLVGIRAKDSNQQIFKSTKYTTDQKIEALKRRLETRKKNPKKDENKIKELEGLLKNLSSKNESVVNFQKFKLFEAVTDGSVEDCFDEFKKSLPQELFEVTQREVDDAGKLATSDSAKIIVDLKNNPDPIIKIIRIFKRALDIFSTPLIPSGRSGGKVSVKTYNEYIKLGKGDDRATPDSVSNAVSPGYGPWAVKKIYDKFTDGILEILEDQKYRKVLANVKFVVPGSEDVFNPKAAGKTNDSLVIKMNQFVKLLEELEADEDKKVKSHGQLLFDFINDLLDPETLGDFEKMRKTLLKKYFGQFGFEDKWTKSEGGSKPSKSQVTANKDDLEEKTLIWTALTNGQSFKCEDGTNPSKYEGSIYAFPIDAGDKKIMLIHVIKKLDIDGKKRFLVKLKFNNIKKFTDALITNKFGGYRIVDDWSLGNPENKVYYGIIQGLKINNGQNLKLVYTEVKPRDYGSIEEKEFQIQSKTQGGLTIAPAILQSVDDQKNQKNVYTDFEQNIITEAAKHETNLIIDKSGKKLIDALKESAKNFLG